MIDVDAVTVDRGGVRVLEDLSLTVPDGEFLILAGANGAGKTTLVRTFNGLITPESGTVRVNGTPVETDPLAARRAVGMVFQHPRDQIVATTVAADVAFGPENLGLDRETIDERVDDALAAVGLADRRNARVDELSGGQRQRLAIAGALAMKPSHLVLDEPFTGLDAAARRSVRSRLEKLHDEGTSVVVVTHDSRSVLGLADRIVVLDDGTIAADAAATGGLAQTVALPENTFERGRPDDPE
ncbi:biotin transport system ATP-binding protein [Halopenitus malekzadehii]|uniref:Biotin transport system ATP-binding protein n=1 Tax=Halopenitus malekzadehii TaxID=1267564 RepID=A0A1H6HQG8_9EURY|nr:ABC transporter ATP-binding protein [Halopenitus malekzadehii]SEH38103.1 biotin transport system ATP-binding protein [Halopenitus malekzadehii]